jgi:hypothetical protein
MMSQLVVHPPALFAELFIDELSDIVYGEVDRYKNSTRAEPELYSSAMYGNAST